MTELEKKNIEKKKCDFYKICMNLINSRDFAQITKRRADSSMLIRWEDRAKHINLDMICFQDNTFNFVAESSHDLIIIRGFLRPVKPTRNFEKSFDKLVQFLNDWEITQFLDGTYTADELGDKQKEC